MVGSRCKNPSTQKCGSEINFWFNAAQRHLNVINEHTKAKLKCTMNEHVFVVGPALHIPTEGKYLAMLCLSEKVSS